MKKFLMTSFLGSVVALCGGQVGAQSTTNGYTMGVQRGSADPVVPQAREEPQPAASRQRTERPGMPPISSGQSDIQPAATVNAIPSRNISSPGVAPVPSAQDRQAALIDNRSASQERIEGFNSAVEQLFPMTPEMIEQMRRIQEENERAMLEQPEPEVVIGTELVSLEPGAVPPTLNVTPNVATVISVYDATGAEWPVEQYVLGDGQNFQVIQLGENANSLTVTPLARVGWTNLILRLKENPTPIVVRVKINEARAHYRHDLQVLAPGPEASVTTASANQSYDFVRPGNDTLVSVLTRTDLPETAEPVGVSGVAATAYLLGDALYIRSRHALLNPAWTGSLTGPDGMRVYRVEPTSVALFSVDGTIIRADLELPR